MWLFGRRVKAPEKVRPAVLQPAAPEIASEPQLVRRVEITVEREWTSTVVRRRIDEGAAGSAAAKAALEGRQPAEGSKENKP